MIVFQEAHLHLPLFSLHLQRHVFVVLLRVLNPPLESRMMVSVLTLFFSNKADSQFE